MLVYYRKFKLSTQIEYTYFASTVLNESVFPKEINEYISHMKYITAEKIYICTVNNIQNIFCYVLLSVIYVNIKLQSPSFCLLLEY